MVGTAVNVSGVSKTFRIYHDRNQSLKATVLKGGRAKYEEFKALDDVTFEVPEGGTFGLLGRNGSGKSTLLKCIAGILTPNAGTITTRGRIAAMLEVGSGFHPELTGRENVYLNGSILGMSRAELDSRFDEIVDFSGLGDFVYLPMRAYSAGMSARLRFAISTAATPDILMIDEALATGDAAFREKSRERIDEIREQAGTIFLVSHSLASVRAMCNRVIWIDKGLIRMDGDVDTVTEAYREFTKNRRKR